MSPVSSTSCFSIPWRTSWLLPPCGFEDPRKTSLSIPPPFRLGQSLRISPPIGFVDLSSSYICSSVFFFTQISFFSFTSPSFSLPVLRHTLLTTVFWFLISLSFSRRPSLQKSASPLSSVSLISRLFPPSSTFPLMLLGCSRDRLRLRSCRVVALSIPLLFSVVSLSSSCLRLLFLRPLGYLFTFLLTRFWLSPVIILRLPSLSSSSSILLLLLGYSRYRPSSGTFSRRRYQVWSSVLSSYFSLAFSSRLLCSLFSSAHYVRTFRGSTRINILIVIGLSFRLYSRQSIFGSTRPPFIHLLSCPSRVLYVFIHSSTSSSCFDILSTTVVVLRSWPSWVCRVSNSRVHYSVLGVPPIRCSWWM